uniref:Uncharacterized protein n=1 Tax=Candidatus Kentrum sp. SD TaxID=2126332 RepID=A0A450YUV2_9GAMM|nr:MAG: hypothetical protein BECKSD772F_GA0070984_12201 [Candidatus Kentron sp. SD]VFK49713.1 MAG: hypothetical protein BECKSD772E_GA0070983_12211 [Candidatus Kentron sp. SD]
MNPVDLMLLEGMRVFIPELYELIRKNKEMFVDSFRESTYYDPEPEKARIKEEIDSALKRAGAKDSSGYMELLKSLFPKMNTVYGNTIHGDHWHQKWNEGQRICAEKYFDRYFTYAVPKGDFPDTKLNALIEDICDTKDLTPPENNPLAAAVTEENAESLIDELRIRAESLNAEQSVSLSLAVSLAGDKYPNPETILEATPHAQAAMLVSDLIQNMDKSRRVSLAIERIEHSPTAAFQLEIFKWLRKEEEDSPEKDAFTAEELDTIGKELDVSEKQKFRGIEQTRKPTL